MVNCDYLYDKEYFGDRIERQYFADKELSYKCYENAYIVPNKGYYSGVYTRERKYITGVNSALSQNDGEFDNTQYLDETIIFLDFIVDVWGHVITDEIRRFWFLKTNTFLEKYKDCKCIICNIDENSVSENIYKLFEIVSRGGHSVYAERRNSV